MADFAVVGGLGSTPSGHPRYRCLAPARWQPLEEVAVSELAVDAGGWHQLADHLGRICAVEDSNLLELLELGPDLDQTASGVYLVTEPFPGGTLDEPAGPLSTEEKLDAVVAAADAVHAMHEAGLVHGGLDARCIFITSHGPALGPPALDYPSGMITAFSAWRAMAAVDPDLLCGEPPSRSSDIWSLGATLHGALSESSLYKAMESDEAVTAVQRLLFSTPVIDGRLQPELAEVIAACLEPDPSQRPQTAAEVASRLRTVQVAA